MGFLMGSSCFVQPSLSYPLYPSSSRSIFLYPSPKNSEPKRRGTVRMASMSQDESSYRLPLQRRAILFVGISVLPFFHLRARALEDLATKKNEEKTSGGNQIAEQALHDPPNAFFSLLNAVGILSSGVLGALYASAQKEKAKNNATIESMKTKIKQKESAIISLEKNFELKLLSEKEERTKQLRKEKEEQQSLIDQLNSANSTIAGLGQQLNSEKRLIKELKFQISSLETDLSTATQDKNIFEEDLKEKLELIGVLEGRINLLNIELRDKEDNVQNLRSSLADKDLGLKNLKTTNDQLNDVLGNARSEIQHLKDELVKNQKEIESKNYVIEELNATVSSLSIEKDQSEKKLNAIEKEYNDLKLSSEKKAALDAKVLGEKEEELQLLKEKLKLAWSEASQNQEIIAKLTEENEKSRKLLDEESNKVNNLKLELDATQERLAKSRDEGANLEKHLIKSNKLCKELEGEVSRVQAEFAEVRESLQGSLDEAKVSGEELAGELTAVKGLLKTTKQELQHASIELAAVVEDRNSLQQELVDVYKKAESAASDLNDERNTVSSLNKELQSLEKQITKDKETRKSLETDLEEATRSLDEMNRNALILSRDLEKANSRISELEDEKQVLYKSLTEQKNASKEARENMEDAHNLVLRLGEERETLDKRAKKLEVELSSAKGEILRLRSQINSSKAPINIKKPEKVEAEDKVKVTAKRTVRRRKDNSSQ
ncbi:MAR-binding filament-like protein [Parasponia andersonii]|uniref:MAR-binding filament-like protein n=1 Tax=Parasponia andersonii TaxID=3476 RepID=A0A2P5AHI7_PARAD|nr:MAR-binding filament-like protein [Parasponia andersonii]